MIEVYAATGRLDHPIGPHDVFRADMHVSYWIVGSASRSKPRVGGNTGSGAAIAPDY